MQTVAVNSWFLAGSDPPEPSSNPLTTDRGAGERLLSRRELGPTSLGDRHNPYKRVMLR
jgi:hypothetical protein